MARDQYTDLLEQPSAPTSVWKTALYIRLSREDGDKAESDSIGSQREILKEYLKHHPDMELVDIYADDGYSGTNFDRPDFKRMMEDVEAKRINCIVVKDLSRFGRNYIEVGNFLDKVFVLKHIRFIALNNNYDNVGGYNNAVNNLITVGVTNVTNETYAANTSLNVRGTLNLRRQQGKFIGSFATYGYLKDPQDHHKLIVDPDTAPIVQMIFERFIGGESIIGIAKDLNEMGIPNPSLYKKLKGFNYKHPAGRSNDGLWPDSSVRRILQNRMYLGDMVQGKNTTYSYKLKQCYTKPKDEWIVVEGTHEAIIDQETFDKAQSLFNKHIRKSPKKNDVDLFSGLVRCADCQRIMNKKTNEHPYATYHYYRCVTTRKMKKSACTNHTIRIDKLEKTVLLTIQKMIDTAATMSEMLDRINSCEKRQTQSVTLKQTIEMHLSEREKTVSMIADLYPDWKQGVITQDEYMVLKERLNNKLRIMDEKLEALNKTAAEFQGGIDDENDFVSHFKKYGNIEKLTRALVTELIDTIFVHEGGDVEIVFKFKDAYAEAVEYIEMNKDLIDSEKLEKTKKSA